jgi:pilus assembly protein FimV
MVRNKLAAVVAAFGALQADVAGALGLGDFTLNSALNQPLDAEIRLLDTADLDKAQIIIKLASAEDFDNAGVIRDFFLTNLRFDVELDGSGAGVIRVTSREPVLEPYLDIMVEARWPSGRLLREYTVLLDLPVFSDSQAEAISAPSTQQVVPEVRVEAKPAPMPAAPVQTSASVPVLTEDRKTLTEGVAKAGETYRVRRDETLWEIALKARPTKKLSVQQTMMGIQRNNPHAFINGNINRLKAGSVLRLPTEQEVRTAVSRNQAVSEVAQQNRQWKTGEPIPTEAPLQAKAAPAAVSRPVSEEPRLTIAAADDGDAGSISEGGQAPAGEGVGALQNELAKSQESLDKAKLDNEEMSQRLENMEDKLATMQRLLELKDEQLASLQQSAAKSTEQVPSVAVKSAEQPAEKPAPAKPVVDPAEAEQDLISMLLANPAYLGGGGALLILLLLLALRKGKSSKEEEAEQLEAMDQPAEELADVAIEESAVELDEESFEAIEEAVEAESSDMAESAELEPVAVEPEHETQAAPVTSQTGDAVAEADIYIAYGRFQQAIDLLNAAIEQGPSSALYLKLLEVCVESRNKDSFLSAYGALQASGDEQAVAEAKELLSTSDEVAGWLDGVADQSAASVEESLIEEPVADSLDLESSLDDELSAELDEALADLELGDSGIAESADLSELSLDDELEAGEEFSLELDAELEAEPAVADDLDLDFDKLASQDESVLEESLADLDLDLDLDEQPGLDDEFSALEDVAESLDLEGDEALNLVDEQPGLDGEFAAEGELSLGEELEEGLDLDLDLDLDADLDSMAGAADLDDLAAEFDQPAAAEQIPSEEEAMELVDDLEAELSEVTEDLEAPVESVLATEEVTEGDDLDMLAGADEVATKLDLARAYIDMGDSEGASEILDEVISEGTEQQQQEAKELQEKL